jgi:hypothetical protein
MMLDNCEKPVKANENVTTEKAGGNDETRTSDLCRDRATP